MVKLRKVDTKNLWKIVNLHVNKEQEDFVATNAESIMEAYVTVMEDQVALPFGIYDGETPVGFVMFGYGTTDVETDPTIADGNYCIWRFMIDKEHQGKGYGKQGLQAALDYVKTKPCGDAEYVWLSYEPENTRAEQLYESFGFRRTGEICDDEIVSALKL